MTKLICFLILLGVVELQAQQQPNILLVILDDIGVAEIPRYNPLSATKAKMPNLEALMDRGLTFDNVWSNPVCAPSRANILTGKHGFRTEVLNAQSLATLGMDELTLHEHIRTNTFNAYATSLIGKWHLGGGGGQNTNLAYPNELGIGHFAGIMSGGVGDYNRYELVENGVAETTTDYITTKFSDLAIEWIREQDQLWFCWLAYNAPHTPLHLPPLDLHSYDNLDPSQDAIDTDPQPYYLAMIESVDTEMGRVIASIPDDEIDNTVIVVVGDNGTARGVVQQPYSRNQGKGSLYQGGVHVPMVVAGAGVERQNENEAALVQFSDLFSTIFNLAVIGSLSSTYKDSKSFNHLLGGEGEGQRDCMYTESATSLDSISWASRDVTYKYISKSGEAPEFYNLIEDPYEKEDLLPNLTAEEQVAYDKLNQVKEDLSPTMEIKQQEAFSIFPNPASGVLNVVVYKDVPLEYQILNAAGALVKSGVLSGIRTAVNLEDLVAGSYIFIVEGGSPESFVKVD